MLTIKGSRQTISMDYEKLKLNAPINNLYPTGDGVSKGANCMNHCKDKQGSTSQKLCYNRNQNLVVAVIMLTGN